MDFKSILQHLSQLSEAKTETETGVVHKAAPGGYGRKFDTDDEGGEKVEKKPAVKRGRGRPKKGADSETGEVKKYAGAKDLQSFMVGNLPKGKLPGKPTQKHKLKEYFDQLDEMMTQQPIPVVGKQGDTQSTGAGFLNITDNSPAGQAMKDALGKLAQQKKAQIVVPTAQQTSKPTAGVTGQAPVGTQQVKEKWAGDAKVHATGEYSGKSVEELKSMLAKLKKSGPHPEGSKEAKKQRQINFALRAKGGWKKGEGAAQKEGMAEGRVAQLPTKDADYSQYDTDHLKTLLKPGILHKNEAKFKALIRKELQKRESQGQKGVAEGDIPSTSGVDTQGAGLGAGRSQTTLEAKAKPDFLDLDKDGNKKESMKKAASDKKKAVKESMNTLEAAYHEGKSHGLGGHSYSCRYDEGSPEHGRYHAGFKEGLDECYGQAPIQGLMRETDLVPATVPGMADAAMDEGNAFTAALAKTPSGGKFSLGGKMFTDRSGYDSTLDELAFESWDKQLNSLLTENEKVSEGMTVSISKGQQGMPDSVTVSAQDSEADQLLGLIKQAGLGLFGDAGTTGYGSPESAQEVSHAHGDIDVVDDHDGMMALMKKLTGSHGSEAGQDHEEGGEDHSEEACGTCGAAPCNCDDEEMVDEVESYDQEEEEVAEDNPPDSGSAETTADENAEAAEDQALAQADEEQVTEWANDAGEKAKDFDEESFTTDIDFMTKMISGGLNKPKSTGQTTIPVIAGQNDRMGYSTNESIQDWKKLAGI